MSQQRWYAMSCRVLREYEFNVSSGAIRHSSSRVLITVREPGGRRRVALDPSRTHLVVDGDALHLATVLAIEYANLGLLPPRPTIPCWVGCGWESYAIAVPKNGRPDDLRPANLEWVATEDRGHTFKCLERLVKQPPGREESRVRLFS